MPSILSYVNGYDKYSKLDLLEYSDLFSNNLDDLSLHSMKKLNRLLLIGRCRLSHMYGSTTDQSINVLVINPHEPEIKYQITITKNIPKGNILVLNQWSDETNQIVLYAPSESWFCVLNLNAMMRKESRKEVKCKLQIYDSIPKIQSLSWITPTRLAIRTDTKDAIFVDITSNIFTMSKVGNDIAKYSFTSSIMPTHSCFFRTENEHQTLMFTQEENALAIHSLQFSSSTKLSWPTNVIAESQTKQVIQFYNDFLISILDPHNLNIQFLKDDQTMVDYCMLPNQIMASLASSRMAVAIWDLDKQRIEREAKYWTKYIAKAPALNYEDTSSLQYSNTKPMTEPKHGKDDPNNEEHVGGNSWAGGTGGRDTAGLGGKGGPYRLSKGHRVFQIPDHEKPPVTEMQRQMAKEALEQRLKQINMTTPQLDMYHKFFNNIKKEVQQLRHVLASLQAKEREQEWLTNQATGEIDDRKIVEGIAGEKLIYKKRGIPPLLNDINNRLQKKPKILRFVMDVSGSMYRFNGSDERLFRMMEIALLMMESLHNFEYKFQYSIVGHSGESDNIPLVTPKRLPRMFQFVLLTRVRK